MVLAQSESLPYLSSQERLQAYQLIVNGCSHIWSKNKLQWDKAQPVLEFLVPLAQNDPFFLAHLTSYAIKKTKNKDLQVLLTYVASLNSADGSPFSPGSKYKKPNLRYVSAAALHQLDPKLTKRVMEIASKKYTIPHVLNNAHHFPKNLSLALKKYIQYRESNPESLKSLRRAGFKTTFQDLARGIHYNLSDEAREILGWPKRGERKIAQAPLFQDKTDLEIAQFVRDNKMPYIGVLGELARVDKKVSPVIAVALLEQASGNQAVIMTKTFEDAGILTDPEVSRLYQEKISQASTALDRVDHLTKIESEEVKKMMKEARAGKRKESTAGIGKIYLMLDFSPSMEHIIEYAKEKGAIFAECVNDPQNNFKWGWFDSRCGELPLPQEFVADAFAAILFGYCISGGGTDCVALYPKAREFGADIDVIVTDQGHNCGDITQRIEEYHRLHPETMKPKACVIINFGAGDHDAKEGYEAASIPAVEINPKTLTESALIDEAVRNALLGPVAIIDEVMDTELLELPKYYFTL